MTARLFYIDESFDADKFCLSAIGLRHSEWRECFARVREHRDILKHDFGIFVRKEIHSLDFVIEDPVFKKSHQSHFLQLADVVAYSLLKREVAPTPHVKRYDIHKMFDKHLAGVCWKAASPQDPLGIVRK